jgi:hypothetical protein
MYGMETDEVFLGNVRHTFRPKMADIIAGTILGVVLVAGNIALATYLIRRPDPRPLDTGNRVAKYVLILIGVIGFVAPLGGLALLLGMKRLASHRVTVFDGGFVYDYAGKDQICPWTDVSEIRELFTHEELKVLKLPGAAIKNVNRSFVVCRKDGAQYSFTVNSIDSIPKLAEFLESARDEYGIPWEQIVQQ